MRRFLLLVLSASVCLMSSVANRLAAQTGTQIVVASSADTWISNVAQRRSLNFGPDTSMTTRNSISAYDQLSFLKFDLQDLQLPPGQQIESVRLDLTMVYSQSSGGVVNVYGVEDSDDGWDENTLTWSGGFPDTAFLQNPPVASQAVARLSPAVSAAGGLNYQWDITSQVQKELSTGNKIVSLSLFTDYNQGVNVSFLSKESGDVTYRPHLIIQTRSTAIYNVMASADPADGHINIAWRSDNSDQIAYFNILYGQKDDQLTNVAKVMSTQSASTAAYSYLLSGSSNSDLLYYKIEAVMDDSSKIASDLKLVGTGSAVMIDRYSWWFSQVPGTAATQDRLMQTLEMADFNPVGLRVSAGVPATIDVKRIGGTDMPVLIVGTYDLEPVTTFKLHEGLNTINPASSGDIYIQYSSDAYQPGNQLQMTFLDGFDSIPMFIKDKTTHQQWLDALAADQHSPNVVLIGDRAFIAATKSSAIAYQHEDQQTELAYIDRIINAEDSISGLNGILPVHERPYHNKLMGIEKVTPGNPNATSKGRIRVPADWILSPARITEGNAWGLFHELGHHHQQAPWSWAQTTEVSVNIYSIAAQKVISPEKPGITPDNWNLIMDYLALPDSLKDYNAGSMDNYVKLGIYVQLWLAYGDQFYHRLHQRTRVGKIRPSDDPGEMALFMKYASEISGFNLHHFFKTWGIPATQEAFNALDVLGLPVPAASPLQLREDWLVQAGIDARDGHVTAGQATINFTAVANGPRNVQRVEFYLGTTKIGESTERPYQLAFNNTLAPGEYELSVKAITDSGEVFASQPVSFYYDNITIVSPSASNPGIQTGAPVEISAAVNVSGLSSVSFYANGTAIGSVQSAPYRLLWQPGGAGVYTLTAKAFYDDNTESLSSAVTVKVGGLFSVGDAFVRQGSPNTNFGQDSVLEVKNDNNASYNRVSYLKFDIRSLHQPVVSADLQLSIVSALSGASVQSVSWPLSVVTDTAWLENVINWNSAPATESTLATVQGKASGTASWEITSYLNQAIAAGAGSISLAVSSDVPSQTGNVSFYSRNSADPVHYPQINIVPDISTPVRMGPLSAKKTAGGVLLEWSTTLESDLDRFEVEGGRNGKEFSRIGAVKAAGNGAPAGQYHFADNRPALGENYYRLKIWDSDGAFKFSPVIHLSYSGQSERYFRVFPNPVSGNRLNIKFGSAVKLSAGTVCITASAGNSVLKQKFTFDGGSSIVGIELPRLPKGIYFVEVLDDNGRRLGSSQSFIIR